jgi:hypothetical protein
LDIAPTSFGPDGHIHQRVDLSCGNDEEAKEQAERLVDGYEVELWHLNRRICDFKSQ